ncbi:tape measure domain-containing protein [Firmicutes bacterium CAG:137]|nr:tape measure domain-containing protein [Firmicutes bacterium CAG:137]
MATIRTAIALYDGVTSPLRSMQKAMGVVLNSFEAIQRASGNSVDVSAIQEAREELTKAETAFDSIEENIRKANNEQQKFNNSIHGGTNAANGLLSTIKKVAVAAGGIAGINKVLNISDELASTKARLNLIVDDGGSVSELEQKIMASAQRSRAAYFDTASAIASMGANAKSAFSGNDELIGFMEQINKQFVIGGASAQGQAAAMLQLTQAMGAGALRGEELNSILENAPGIARAIEDYMGAAEGSIKKYAEEGKITAEVVKNAMFAAADETNAKFESMPKTWEQIWTSMKNKALSTFSPILNKINELMNSAQFTQVVDGLINGLAAVAQIGSFVLDLIINVGSAVVDNWSWIEPIVWGLVGALGAYYAIMLIVNAINAIAATKEAVKAAATMMSTGATFAATAAQHGLNAALLACPITWIVLAVIALVAAIVAVVRAMDVWGASTHSVLGTITGLFMVAVAFVVNLFIAMINFVIDIFAVLWNFIAAFVNFFGNVFNDPVGSIARLFFDLVDGILSLLQSLASAIDTLFGSNLAGAVQGWRDSLDGWVDETFGQGEEIMAKVSGEDLHVERWAYADAFEAGASFGDGISDQFSGLADTSDFGMDQYNLGNSLDGIYNNTGDTAANTAEMSDSLDIAEEDLKYLMDIAERDAINRFTTAEVRIDMTGMTNKIDGSTDLDGVIRELTEGFTEALQTAAEGVHT